MAPCLHPKEATYLQEPGRTWFITARAGAHLNVPTYVGIANGVSGVPVEVRGVKVIWPLLHRRVPY